MNNDVIMGGGAISSTSSEFQLCTSSPETQQIFRPTSHFPIATMNPQQHNPRKKRTKRMRLQNTTTIVGGGSCSGSCSGHHSTKPKLGKKPDPSAPKITPPCSECGKKFWSWKALFGHMRCHPERPWRGINPPVAIDHCGSTSTSTNEERYVASCLLMLASGPNRIEEYEEFGHHPGYFECTSCKKVFGSHQALGGHRASHKNVKGCYAITQKEGGEEVEEGEIESHFENTSTMIVVGSSSGEHKCGICSRVFSSGQALGGHKRCHWEKEDDGVCAASTLVLSQGQYRFDLNSPAPREDYSRSSNLGLDLRLGL